MLDERQVTLIIEAMKTPVSSGHKSNLLIELEGTETSQSRVLKLQLLQRQMQDIYEAEIADLKAKAEADRPKVEFFDAVADSRDAISIGEVAKVLGLPGWGRNRIFSLLRDKGVLMRDNIPKQEYMNRGYFRVIEQKWTTPEGETKISLKTLVYQKGMDFIRRLAAKEAA